MDLEEDTSHRAARPMNVGYTQQASQQSTHSFAVSSQDAMLKSIPLTEDQIVIQKLMSWSLNEKQAEMKTGNCSLRFENTPEKSAYLRWNVSMDSPQTKKKDSAVPIDDSRFRTPPRRTPRLTNEQLERIAREERDSMRVKMKNPQANYFPR